jgi:uncharacterized protein (TIGR00369 family)
MLDGAATHLGIDANLCGTPRRLEAGIAEVALTTTPVMAADAEGLCHGGFLFGLADYAAMLAVNHPNVVLGSATSKFLKPVRVGETVVATAIRASESGRRHVVAVEVRRAEELVFTGEFTCFVLDRHVLAAGGS